MHCVCRSIKPRTDIPQGGVFPVERKHLKSVADRGQRTSQLMPQLGEEVVRVPIGVAESTVGRGVADRTLEVAPCPDQLLSHSRSGPFQRFGGRPGRELPSCTTE